MKLASNISAALRPNWAELEPGRGDPLRRGCRGSRSSPGRCSSSPHLAALGAVGAISVGLRFVPRHRSAAAPSSWSPHRSRWASRRSPVRSVSELDSVAAIAAAVVVAFSCGFLARLWCRRPGSSAFRSSSRFSSPAACSRIHRTLSSAARLWWPVGWCKRFSPSWSGRRACSPTSDARLPRPIAASQVTREGSRLPYPSPRSRTRSPQRATSGVSRLVPGGGTASRVARAAGDAIRVAVAIARRLHQRSHPLTGGSAW